MIISSIIKDWKKQDRVGLLILGLAALLLFSFLTIKPPQHDEGVNGWFIEEVTYQGFYAYDPARYHGPLHFYILFLFKMLFGSNLWSLRLPAVLFSFATIFLFLRFKPYFGKFVAYSLALLAALSPGLIFYSRYAIHESTLYFFSVLTLLGWIRLRYQRDKVALWQFAAGMTGMIVTKETFVLSLGAYLLAMLALFLYELYSPSAAQKIETPKADFDWLYIAKASGICVFVIVLLYSGFFLSWESLLKVWKSIWEWGKIGLSPESDQKGHWKPFVYWLQLFLRYEWPALFGLFCCFPLAAEGTSRWARLFALYSLILFLGYSAISYKTPWCIMQLIWPCILTGLFYLDALYRKKGIKRRVAIGLVALAAVVSFQKSVSLNFFRYTDDKEPYVHVQTYKPLMDIIDKIRKAEKDNPNLKHQPVCILMKAYWPISWLLADYTRTAYYTEGFPARTDAQVFFCDKNRRIGLELKLKRPYILQTFRMNPAQDETYVYFLPRIYARFFPPDAPMFYPAPVDEAQPGQGLRARYFRNTALEGDIAKDEIAGMIDYSWDNKSRPMPAPFGIIFDGEVFAPQRGGYTFYLSSDDGSEMILNGQQLIDNLGNHMEKIKEGEIFLEKGWHKLQVRYFDIGGDADIRLWWRRPYGEQEKISPKYLRPEKTT